MKTTLGTDTEELAALLSGDREIIPTGFWQIYGAMKSQLKDGDTRGQKAAAEFLTWSLPL